MDGKHNGKDGDEEQRSEAESRVRKQFGHKLIVVLSIGSTAK